jgi:hypothetical protein
MSRLVADATKWRIFEQHQRTACSSFGRRRAGQGGQLRLGLAIRDAPSGGVRSMMTAHRTVQAFFNQVRRAQATVSTLVSKAAAIWRSLNPSSAFEASAFSRMRAFSCSRAGVPSLPDHRFQLAPLFIAERDGVFLDGDHFHGHESAPLLGRSLRVRERSGARRHQQRSRSTNAENCRVGNRQEHMLNKALSSASNEKTSRKARLIFI